MSVLRDVTKQVDPGQVCRSELDNNSGYILEIAHSRRFQLIFPAITL